MKNKKNQPFIQKKDALLVVTSYDNENILMHLIDMVAKNHHERDTNLEF
jgi:hypothetical protein